MATNPLTALPTPALLGVLNITPDSFSDGNRFLTPAAALAHARALHAAGAALLDLGAEASSFFRPGINPIDPQEQLHRLLPVLALFTLETAPRLPLLSIDTRSALVARACIAAGAHLINDISAGTHDPAMLPTVAELGVPIILMHIAPNYPATPTADDPDILTRVSDDLITRRDAALRAGIAHENILLDPGLGFGKTMNDNWRLLAGIQKFLPLGHPIVLGLSRKRFLETTPPPDLYLPDLPPVSTDPSESTIHPRDLRTAILTAWAARAGAHIHRVHNVILAQQTLARQPINSRFAPTPVS